ncbi:stage II sporulation protein R [Brevibacillus sp. SYSU BS000544]|uniref:stage II sporulation protein R n=1 Tax=Brevibacillus sp. SYSU BS000544 TaxID=3416443 RepID=UPI003CE528FB
MKRFFFILFAFILAIMSWENQRLAAADIQGNGPIPQESIRLRIIANSDSFQDQWLKRKVRDSIVEQMNQWAKELDSYDEAHSFVSGKLPELQQVVDETIKQHGFTYKAVVDFGSVPFPTKLYGSYVYPAGNYEAVRVRIGEAKGQNWWCVLFPPLCFIDMSNGDAVQMKEEQSELPVQLSDEKEETVESVDKQPEPVLDEERTQDEEMQAEDQNDTQMEADSQATASVEKPEIEVRFYLWDKLVAFF